MNALQSPGRAVAAVGAVVAVGAATMMAVIAGSASAAEPGRCIDNVHVRAQPTMDSEIVALCESGTAVQVGETRNGFVQLVDLGGWSSAEFVSVNGAEPAVSDRSATPDEQDGATSPGSSTDDAGSTDDEGSTGDTTDTTEEDGQRSAPGANDDSGDAGDAGADESAGGSEEPEAESAGGSPLDGLLG
jgi:hypothetical protein